MKKIKIVAFRVNLFRQRTTECASALTILFEAEAHLFLTLFFRVIFLEADGVLDGVLSQAGLVAAGILGHTSM